MAHNVIEVGMVVVGGGRMRSLTEKQWGWKYLSIVAQLLILEERQSLHQCLHGEGLANLLVSASIM
jgi:hypothetical protein